LNTLSERDKVAFLGLGEVLDLVSYGDVFVVLEAWVLVLFLLGDREVAFFDG
jgi:hypothetical protein